MASSLSWILRSSSVPVLRQSARRRRREEARSWQRSRFSSAEGKHRARSLLPSSPSSHKCLWSISQVPGMAVKTHGAHLPRAGCGADCQKHTGPHVMGFRPERGKATQNEGRKGKVMDVRALDNCLDGHGMLSTRRENGRASVRQAHRGGSAGHLCAAPGSRSAAPPHPCTLCPGCRSCRHRRRPAPRGDPVRSMHPA